jgi:hypothetical protein
MPKLPHVSGAEMLRSGASLLRLADVTPQEFMVARRM